MLNFFSAATFYIILSILGVFILSANTAHAACDVTSASSSSASSFSFTATGQTKTLCITNDVVRWGLYPSLGIYSNYNSPIGNTTGTNGSNQLLSFADYTYTSSKAVYLLHPRQGAAAYGHAEIDITLVSQTASGADTLTLYYSSVCSDSGTCNGANGATDSAYTISIASLPAMTSAPTVSATFAATSVTQGASTNLTITLSNPNASTDLTGVSLAVTNISSAVSVGAGSSSCTGGGTPGTLTSNTGTGGAISISGATVTASSTCTYTIPLTGVTAASAFSYTTGAISATGPSSLNGTATTTTNSLTVNALPVPVLTFATPNAASVTIIGSLTNAASSNLSGGSYGAISYSSSDNGVATVSSSGVITPVSIGTATVTATQAAVTGVNAQATKTYTLTVTTAPQTISFISNVPSSPVVGDTYNVSADSTSNLTVSLTIDAASAAVCSISGNTVSFDAEGSCVINADQAGNATYAAATREQQTVSVSKKSQTIGFTSGVPPSPVIGDTYNVTADATSNLTVALTIDSGSSAVCSISGNTVSFDADGSCVINADQAGNATYAAATREQQTVSVSKKSQTIGFTSITPSSPVIGDTYNVIADATSNFTVALTIDAGSAAVCSISGNTVSFDADGSCVINADQAGNATYAAAPRVQQTMSVSKKSQSVSFISSVPSAAFVGDTYSVSADATSNLTVVFSIDAGSAAVCSISGNTVSFDAAGSCVINADQAGNATYAAATRVQQTMSVSKKSQTIGFTSITPSSPVIGDTYNVTADATSNLTVILSIDAGSTAVCSISGNTVSFDAAGSCVIIADQAGNATYSAAPGVQQTMSVSKKSQTISFTSAAPPSPVIGDSYSVTVDATSNLTVVLSIDAGSTAVCSISGNTVSFDADGSCVINADQAGNATYSAATRVQQTMSVGKKSQTVSFTSAAPSSPVIGDTYSVVADATSNLTVVLSIDAGSAAICSISGNSVSFDAAGSCVINADQAGNATYSAAPQMQQTIAVSKKSQTINFTSAAPSTAAVGDTYTVSADATSNLAVIFSIDAGSTAICSISGNSVSFDAAGSCVINADQSGNATYLAGSRVQQTISVSKQSQTISFTSSPPPSPAIGDTYTVTADATSNLSVVFSIDAGSAAVCSISGNSVSFDAAGSCVINADQAGNASYEAAPRIQQTLSVTKKSQTISFSSSVPSSPVVGGTYAVSADSTSNLTVSFSIDAGSSAICSILGNTVSFDAEGSCVINADQAGNATYEAAPQKQQTVAVGKASQTISFTSSIPSSPLMGDTYTVSADSTSNLTVVFSIDSGSAATCSISGNTVTFNANGNCVINADQAGNTQWAAAPQKQQTVVVGMVAQTISFISTAPSQAAVGERYKVKATSSAGLKVAFSIDAASANICSLAGKIVTFDREGLCVILADQAGNATVSAGPQVQQEVNVGRAPQTLRFTGSIPAKAKVGDSFNVSAKATSGLRVRLSVDKTGTCSIVSGLVTFNKAGDCVISASQRGNAIFMPADTISKTVTVRELTVVINNPKPVTVNAGNPVNGFSPVSPRHGVKPYRFSVSPALPSGLRFDAETGRISGTPTGVVKARTYRVTVRDAVGNKASGEFTLQVEPGIAALSSLSPSSGPQTGGTVVTISGRNLSAVTRVMFGKTQASFRIISATKIEAIAPPGTGAVPVVVISSAGRSKPAMFTYVVGDPAEVTHQAIKEFMAARADMIMTNLPDPNRRIGRLKRLPAAVSPIGATVMGGLQNISLGAPATVSMSMQEFNARTGDDLEDDRFDIWFQASANLFNTDLVSSSYAFASVGADYLVTDRLLVGGFIQYDGAWQQANALTGAISGNGFMAGPYATAKLTDHIYIDGLVAAGLSSNKISPFGTYQDHFQTSRYLGSAALVGDWQIDNWSFTPSIRYTTFGEESKAYTDSNGILIDSVTNNLSQVTVGPAFGYTFQTEEEMEVKLDLKFETIFKLSDLRSDQDFDRVRGRVEADINVVSVDSIMFGLSLIYDGIGTSQRAYGGMIRISSGTSIPTPMDQPQSKNPTLNGRSALYQ